MTEQKFVNEAVYREHSKMCDERFRRDKEDIENYGADIDDIKKLTAEISQLVKQNDAVIKAHEKRLYTLEHKPSVWLERIISAGISTLVAALVSAVLQKG